MWATEWYMRAEIEALEKENEELKEENSNINYYNLCWFILGNIIWCLATTIAVLVYYL